MRKRLAIAMLIVAVTVMSARPGSVRAAAPPGAPPPLAPSIIPPGFPGPLPAVATAARAGRLTAWMVLVGARPRAGAEDGEIEMVQELSGFDYAIGDVRAFDTKGRAITTEEMRRLLKRECRVVIAQAGTPIDARHLRWLDEGVLLLVVPEKPLAQWSATPK